jgi:hypothetical protein
MQQKMWQPPRVKKRLISTWFGEAIGKNWQTSKKTIGNWEGDEALWQTLSLWVKTIGNQGGDTFWQTLGLWKTM